ncbi:MAG: branched-chain amino acid ABC transporter permease [Candidatus Sumerlaeaceae bacterium]|nr:branched-chain amino acid ABC transporter permease [Candidatus Sumerlaeaceae bacterium]
MKAVWKKLNASTTFWGLAFVAVAASLPTFLRWATGEGYETAANILVLVGIGSIAALGLNIIVGYCGLLNLGFAGFMLIGAYTTGILMKEYHWNFWLAMLASIAHGAFWGIVLGIPTLRLTGDYFAIVTFGFSELVIMVARNWDHVTRGSKGYPGVPRPPAFDFTWLSHAGIPGAENFKIEFTIAERGNYWYLVAVLLGICLFVSHRLLRSRLGRAWQALREDEVAAEACGINAMWYKTIAFAISAGFGALAGSFQSTYYTLVDVKNFEFMTSVFVLCYVVLGGMGTVFGPVAGAAVLVSLVELLRDSPAKYLAKVMGWWPGAQEKLIALPWVPDMRLMIYGAILIIMIRFRPEGLFPSRSRSRELHELGIGGVPDHETLFDLRSR